MQSSPHLNWLEQDLSELAANNLLRHAEVRTPLPQGKIKIAQREYLDCSSNDYLGYALLPEIADAAMAAGHAYGTSARASQLISGYTPIHAELAQAIASYEQTEAAILFPSGYAANVGTIAALADKEDLVICERNNHACLIDGCRLSGARFKLFRHDELDHLEKLLHKETGYKHRFLITDTVFSMEGNVAPLVELCDLADRYDLTLIVDEAHATGILGPHGTGAVSQAGLCQRISVRIGTLSKALASQGGFVAGSQTLIDYLWNHARTQMFSTGLSPLACGAALAAIHKATSDTASRETLTRHILMITESLHKLGISTINHPQIPIIPIILQTPERTMQAAELLKSAGFIVGAIRPPTVPHNLARLRVSLSAAHQTADIQALAETLPSILEKL